MVEITSRGVLDPTQITEDFSQFVDNLNIAAASGKQFVIATENRDEGDPEPVALNTQLIARIRPVDVEDAFVSR